MDHMPTAEARRVRAQFEALLLEPLLRPIEQALGPYGELAAQGFAEVLAPMLERVRE